MANSSCDRRVWLASTASLLLSACGRGSCCGAEAKKSPVDTSEVEVREVDFGADAGGPQKAVVLSPRWGSADTRYPLLVALHGRGESNRGLDVGAWGWARDYWLDRALIRSRTPPLTSHDMLGLTDQNHLGRLNRALVDRPFRGLVVACPYTPDILATDDLDAAESFATFLADHLIPRVRESFPVDARSKATAIDGVSLGGRMALLAGFSRPDLFGAIGSLQAALRVGEIAAVAARGAAATRRVGELPVRLLTSEGDPFRPTLHKLAQALGSNGVRVEYQVVPGPHDYDFNRGPGAYEMLLWHDRVLRGDPGV